MPRTADKEPEDVDRAAIQLETQPGAGTSVSASDAEGGSPMIERMTLSRLRACIRAGAYRDDLTSQEEGSCSILRWLVR
jgi:hypothetical protein